LYIEAYPERIGTLDGLPTTVRDIANRLALRLAAHDAALDRRREERAENLNRTLEAAEYGPGAPLYLLDINNKSVDGTAVVAVGNPDTARHQAVIVPGVNSALDGMTGEIERAGRLQTSADHMANARGDVAVIAWLNYDSPGQDPSAVNGSAAASGAPELAQFVDVMRQTSDHTHVTVVGHSYGSVVVGHAAASGGLNTNDIVTAGSPGMDVASVNDLRIDAHHVWAGAAQGDDVSGWLSHFAHGTEPHTDEFGANRFVVDTTGHSAYWDPDTISLKNQAAIVVGRYELVTLVHGSAPT
jgi:pimeloyl-ACP methyl ester carboxylesterase